MTQLSEDELEITFGLRFFISETFILHLAQLTGSQPGLGGS
jgi:hypothetical protein